MIFVGDIAVPNMFHVKQLEDIFQKHPHIFLEKTLVCNFEGLIHNTEVSYNKPVLFNHPEVIRVIKERGDFVAGLANNHILDLPNNFENTINKFIQNDVTFVGAGKTKKEALLPVYAIDGENQIIIFNACWDFLLYNQKNPNEGVYVRIINENHLINEIVAYRKENPLVAIAVYLHWNFDMETLPFPMHRKFARKLIDSGANMIIGAHSHCVQGGEKYNNGYILYGLGNFFIPNGEYAGGKLIFPSLSKTELVLEWDIASNSVLCHWFEYLQNGDAHELKFLSSSEFENCARLKAVSPFMNMNDSDYLKYYKNNRRKKFLIPVYRDFSHRKLNYCFTLFLKLRATFLRFLAKRNIIKWQN